MDCLSFVYYVLQNRFSQVIITCLLVFVHNLRNNYRYEIVTNTRSLNWKIEVEIKLVKQKKKRCFTKKRTQSKHKETLSLHFLTTLLILYLTHLYSFIIFLQFN